MVAPTKKPIIAREGRAASSDVDLSRGAVAFGGFWVIVVVLMMPGGWDSVWCGLVRGVDVELGPLAG